ncbi:MAG TPA: methyl-accepting chemotaxis protein, partial [Polyangiaceae bacterium]|nr:methyl-accepting chemotaxis protein [Polyangiaceae bacterium]
RTLLEARRREKDFFLRDGDNQYRELVVKHGETFLKTSAELKPLASKNKLLLGDQQDLALNDVDDAMHEYLAAFDKAAAAFSDRGLEDSGAQGRMRKAARDLERMIEGLENPEAELQYLQTRRHEKDFLLRDDVKYQDQARESSAKIEHALAKADLKEDDKRRARDLINDYNEQLGSMVAASVKLDQFQQKMHEAHTRMEPRLRELSQRTTRASATLMNEVQIVRSQAMKTLLIAFGTVLVLGAASVTWVSRQIALGVTQLMEGTRRVATGDLTTPVKLLANDELGQLGESFNVMMSGLRDLSSRINETATSLTSLASELTATVSEQSAAVRQQAAAVTETVSTIEEMTRSASGVADTAQNVSSSAATSVETSTRGEAALKQSVDSMLSIRDQVQNIASTILELSEKTQQIGGIIATVDDFAEQSSLLALNASIEAARAGEQGKAFTVVATEIKKLAEQSQQATDKVRGILNEIQRATHSAVMVTEEGSKRVDRGVNMVETAGQIVMELVETIKGSARSAKQIAAAAQQQAGGIEQVSTAMTGIDQSARQNVAAIKQTETASQTLSDITQQLQKTTARYRMA